jgi:nucleotide-binding universal stress UspA family protein
MGKFNKILVAVDGSEASKNALRQAFKLAFDEKMWITVLAINPPYRGDLSLIGVSNISEVLKGRGEEILEEAKKIAEEERASIKTRLEEGEPYEKIVEVAEEEKCQVIFMGRRGLSQIERSLMGSVTAKVIGHFKGRIFVIPEGKSLGWRNILVATDNSSYSHVALEEAINYAASYNGSLNVVNVVYTNDEYLANAPDVVAKMIENAKSYLQEIKKRIDEKGLNGKIYVREGEPFRKIVDLAKEIKADTIIMGSHGRTGLKRVLMGSVTSRVIGYAPCPIMVVTS